MEYADKNLTCKDCGNEFVWTSGEQKFFADKGLLNPPSRCKDCRGRIKEAKANRKMYTITCKKCGKSGEIPFEPFNPSDVFCQDCFNQENQVNQS